MVKYSRKQKIQLFYATVHSCLCTKFNLYIFSLPVIPNGDLPVRQMHPPSGVLGISGAVGPHHLARPHMCQQEIGIIGKPYNQYGGEPLVTSGLEELRGNGGLSVVHMFQNRGL